tara:strand:- start:646 stop:795 length:150 start_codon:yes stop_codon:yes gene_type:complete
MGKRYITYYGYFGPTSNVKDAPAALTGDVVARLLGAIPAAAPTGERKPS